MADSKPSIMQFDMAVIGGGPAGLAAAFKAQELGVKVVVIERDHELGGILQQCIHNGFGLRYFKKELTGPEYSQRFIDKIKQTKVEILLNTMVIELIPRSDTDSVNQLVTISPQQGLITIQAKTVILAMGCRERTRGAINVPGTRPAGIFPAGQAQRLLNMEGYLPGKRVLIIGSGDIGMIMARRCTMEGMKVLAVAEVLPYPSGLKRNQVQCLEDYGIPLYLRHTVTDIRGRERVTGATIAEVDDKWRPMPGTEKDFDIDTILFSVGLIPENELSSKAGLTIASNGGPNVNENLQTTNLSIFACGNVLQVHDLVDWVTLEAERAGENATKYLKGELSKLGSKKGIKIIPGENVGYVVPERIDFPGEEKVIQFSYRVRSPRKDIQSELVSGGKVIYSTKHRFVVPSEMIIIKPKLRLEDINGEITVNVIETRSTVNVIEKEMLHNG